MSSQETDTPLIRFSRLSKLGTCGHFMAAFCLLYRRMSELKFDTQIVHFLSTSAVLSVSACDSVDSARSPTLVRRPITLIAAGSENQSLLHLSKPVMMTEIFSHARAFLPCVAEAVRGQELDPEQFHRTFVPRDRLADIL
jgi:hypothetical protein